jgi:hypothetical protein
MRKRKRPPCITPKLNSTLSSAPAAKGVFSEMIPTV